MVKEERIKFLVIDDDADDRDFFEIALEMTGTPYILTAIESAFRALELLPDIQEVPDYIFLDLNMPLVSGKEFLKHLRESKIFRDVPVIIFSTSSYQKDVDDTRELGATHFLSKTPDIDRLSEIIKNIISKRNLAYILT